MYVISQKLRDAPYANSLLSDGDAIMNHCWDCEVSASDVSNTLVCLTAVVSSSPSAVEERFRTFFLNARFLNCGFGAAASGAAASSDMSRVSRASVPKFEGQANI